MGAALRARWGCPGPAEAGQGAIQAVCAKCSRLMCRAVVLFLVAECAQTTPMIAPLPGDPNFSIDGSVAFFKSGESNPTQPNPPPPAALTRRPTGPRPTPAAARQPPRREYTPGGQAGDNGRQADARRGGGAGGAAPPPPPPPHPPPRLGSHRGGPPPPRSRGDAPPPPQKGPRRAGGGGGCGWTCSRGGRGRRVSPHKRAGATRAPEQYGGRGPNDPPVTTAHSGRAEGGFRSAGAPGGAVHGPPLTPPHPGAAPRPRPHAHAGGECADDARGARVEYRRPPPRRGAGRPRREPPPPPETPPPPARKPRGFRPPSPGAGGSVPPPARERSRSATRPPAPAAGSHRGRGEQASPRQRARTPHRSRPEKAGEHEPEWYGWPRPPWTERRQ